MMKKNKYSFVIPTYNRSYCIVAAINSVLQQDYDNFEIIIVDDGSTDNTIELVTSLGNNKIRFIQLKQNGGPNIARNRGAEIAVGDWLIFLDSDDVMKEKGLCVINDLIEEKKCDLLFVPCESVDGKLTNTLMNYNGFVTYKEYLKKDVKGISFKGEFLPCVKTKVFLKFKYYENIIGGEGLTWLAISREYKFFVSNISCRLYNNVNEDRLSFLTKKNIIRIEKIRRFDIKINIIDYLRYAPVLFIKNIAKICYYKILIFIK